ncbi:MAG: hypothetical protein GY794_24640 [bacterium]|nr:hypothetical protein [bacterium]
MNAGGGFFRAIFRYLLPVDRGVNTPAMSQACGIPTVTNRPGGMIGHYRAKINISHKISYKIHFSWLKLLLFVDMLFTLSDGPEKPLHLGH